MSSADNKPPWQKHPLLCFLTLAVLFVGGAGLGVSLAEWRAPGSILAQFLAFFVFPISFISAFSLWRGFAIISALVLLAVRWRSRAALAADLEESILRRAFVMIPAPLAFATPCGLIVGLLGGTPVSTTLLFLGAGLAYGLALYFAGRHGMIPLAE